MRYAFECTSCKERFTEDYKLVDMPDFTECIKCGGKALNVPSIVLHIGEKVKGYAGGSSNG